MWFMKSGNGSEHHYYRSLVRNMVLTIIVASVTPMLIISAITGYQFHTSYYGKVLAYLQELVQKHKQNIDGFLEEKMNDIQFLAGSFSFEQLTDETTLAEILTRLQQEHGGVFVDLGVVNSQGIQVAYAGPFKLGRADYSDADWFRKAAKSRYFISDVFLGLRGLPHFIITVKSTTDGQEWILRSTIDFVAFNSLVENVRIGETGLAYIVNRDGDYQTKPRLEPVLDKNSYLRFLSDAGQETKAVALGEGHFEAIQETWKRKSVENQIVVLEEKDSADRQYVCVMTSLKKGEWILVYQQAATDAFSELYQARRLAFLVLFVGSLLVVVAAIVVSKQMVLHITRADREKEMMNEQVIEAGKLASVGELAAGIAHEINNPVAIMVEEAGWIEDLLMEKNSRKVKT